MSHSDERVDELAGLVLLERVAGVAGSLPAVAVPNLLRKNNERAADERAAHVRERCGAGAGPGMVRTYCSMSFHSSEVLSTAVSGQFIDL